VSGNTPGNPDTRAEHPDDERVALTDNLDFAADTQAHGHEPLDGCIAGINAMHDGPGAGWNFAETVFFGGGLHEVGESWEVF
jgi:hypothetical protein